MSAWTERQRSILDFALSSLLRRAGEASRPAVARMAATVKALGLTDLCLFTDAAYTRHLALADGHAPFQEHPACLEHFPAGSLAGPPAAGGR